MTKAILLALVGWFAYVALHLLIAPHSFYTNVPGVADSGPYNSHFMRDVGFAFLVSAGALGLGVLKGNKALALAGAAFPLLHGAFHLQHWVGHGLPVNAAALMDVGATAGTATMAILLALRVKGGAV